MSPVSAHSSPLETRRILDVAVSLPALVVLAPLLALIAALIWLEDGAPVLFRQERVGRFGRCFRILKLRTMAPQSPGKLITVAGDSRITRTGALLRRLKLDELLQLVNVLKGEMSLCGPRPEVPCYVNRDDPLWQAVLQARPGITDPASLLYGQEERVLAHAADPEKAYQEYVLPHKLKISAQYLSRRTCWTDLKLVLLTVRYSFLPGFPAPHFIYQVLFGGRP